MRRRGEVDPLVAWAVVGWVNEATGRVRLDSRGLPGGFTPAVLLEIAKQTGDICGDTRYNEYGEERVRLTLVDGGAAHVGSDHAV